MLDISGPASCSCSTNSRFHSTSPMVGRSTPYSARHFSTVSPNFISASGLTVPANHTQLESTKEELLKLQKDKENSDNIISKLRQELSLARESHKTHIQELESSALKARKCFEHRIKEVDLMLEDSRKKRRDLEEVLASRMDTWKQKEIMVNQFLGLQIQNIQVVFG